MIWRRIGDKPLSEPILKRFTDAYMRHWLEDDLKVKELNLLVLFFKVLCIKLYLLSISFISIQTLKVVVPLLLQESKGNYKIILFVCPSSLHSIRLSIHLFIHGPLARYVILRVAHAPGMPGTFSPPPRFSDPDMHHGTCMTHVPWCMSGSLTSSFLWSRPRGKTFPAFPAHAQPAILRIWQEAHVADAITIKLLDRFAPYLDLWIHLGLNIYNYKIICPLGPSGHSRQTPKLFWIL